MTGPRWNISRRSRIGSVQRVGILSRHRTSIKITMKIQLDLFLQHFPMDLLKRKGVDCPWCGRGTKAYGYDLDDKLVGRALKIGEYCALNKTRSFWPKQVFGGTDTEFNKLKYWGIIRKNKSMWRLTDLGLRFLENRAALSSKVWVYDDEVIDTEDTTSTIERVEPRWKFLSAHWQNDYIIYPQSPRQSSLLV